MKSNLFIFEHSTIRESLKKIYSSSFKFKILGQSSAFPISISNYSSFNYNSSSFFAQGDDVSFSDRSIIFTQFLFSTALSEKFSLQISPSIAIRNYNDIIFIGGNRVGTGYFRNVGNTQRLGAEFALNGRIGKKWNSRRIELERN